MPESNNKSQKAINLSEAGSLVTSANRIIKKTKETSKSFSVKDTSQLKKKLLEKVPYELYRILELNFRTNKVITFIIDTFTNTTYIAKQNRNVTKIIANEKLVTHTKTIRWENAIDPSYRNKITIPIIGQYQLYILIDCNWKTIPPSPETQNNFCTPIEQNVEHALLYIEWYLSQIDPTIQLTETPPKENQYIIFLDKKQKKSDWINDLQLLLSIQPLVSNCNETEFNKIAIKQQTPEERIFVVGNTVYHTCLYFDTDEETNVHKLVKASVKPIKKN